MFRRPRLSLLVPCAAVVIVAAYATLPDYWITLLNFIGLAALPTLGLVLLTGVGGMLSFGQAAFAGIGAYSTAYLTTVYGLSPWIGLALGLFLTVIAAVLLGFITLMLSGHYLAICTIAWGVGHYYFFGVSSMLGRHDGLHGIPPISIFGHRLESDRELYVLIWIVVAAAIVAVNNLLLSRPGRAIYALKNRARMAEAFGVDTAHYRRVAFVLAALLTCLSGWLLAHWQRTINPTPFNLNAGIEYLLMAVVGGSASAWGALIGSGVVLFLKDQLQVVLPRLLGIETSIESIVFGLMLVIILQRAPHGLSALISRWRPTATPMEQPPPGPTGLSQRIPETKGRATLCIRKACKRFGGLVAVDDASFDVHAGEIVALIGPNGAGKSTLFNLICGALECDAGQIVIHGTHLSKTAGPREVARLGLSRTFQHVQLLAEASALDNVMLGAHLRANVGVVRALLNQGTGIEATLQHDAWTQLTRVGLGAVASKCAGNMSLGEQRVLELARALAADPDILLLDEPAAGLRHNEKDRLAEIIRELRQAGLSILLVEHDIEFVKSLADRIVVMDAGSKLTEGLPADVLADPRVVEAYFGRAKHKPAVEVCDA